MHTYIKRNFNYDLSDFVWFLRSFKTRRNHKKRIPFAFRNRTDECVRAKTQPWLMRWSKRSRCQKRINHHPLGKENLFACMESAKFW